MNDLELADLYDKSADVLEDKGWCRHELWNAAGEVCARGAMLTALHPHADHGIISLLVRINHKINNNFMDADARLAELIGTTDVAHWNNWVVEDKFAVIDAFRNAAKELRNDATR